MSCSVGLDYSSERDFVFPAPGSDRANILVLWQPYIHNVNSERRHTVSERRRCGAPRQARLHKANNSSTSAAVASLPESNRRGADATRARETSSRLR